MAREAWDERAERVAKLVQAGTPLSNADKLWLTRARRVARGASASAGHQTLAKYRAAAAKLSELGLLSNIQDDRKQTAFEQLVVHLTRYVATYGDALVPQDYVSPPPADDDADESEAGFPLGSKVQHVRWDYARGSLNADHIHRLEQFAGWSWNVVAQRRLQEQQSAQRILDTNAADHTTPRRRPPRRAE